MALDYSNLTGFQLAIVFTISLGCAFEYEGNVYCVNDYLKVIYKGENEQQLTENIKQNIGWKYINCITSNYGLYSYLEFELTGGQKRRITINNINIENLCG